MNIEQKVIEWGYDKGILTADQRERRMAQYSKTCEEVDELEEAILDDNREEAIDAIGDIIVTLIMQANLWDTTVTEALESAYAVIAKRTGKMVDGVFVKDEECL